MWVGEVSRDHPDVIFRVLSALAGDGYGVGLVEVESADEDEREELMDGIREHGQVEIEEILWKSEGDFLVQLRTQRPLLLQKAYGAGVPIRMPFEIRDGVGTWELSASRENISRLTDALDEVGVEHDVEHVREVEYDDLLTDKQRDVSETARELGYYDTPREASLSEVAEECGIAKSTCSEILHRAEGKVMKEFLD